MQPILHKYISVDSSDKIDRLKRLLSGWLYFATPLNFNDPFEMSPLLVAPGRDVLEQAFVKIGWTAQGLSRAARRKVLAGIETSLSSNPQPAVSKEWLKSIGVACFSTVSDDLLMWAHYAANHTGICIGFDSSHTPFSTARAVEYAQERPRIPSIRVLQEDELLVRNVLLRKSEHWAYEKEWRAVKRPIRQEEIDYYSDLVQEDYSRADEIADVLASEGGPGMYEFDPTAVRRIYLGARMPRDAKNQLIEIIRTAGAHIRIFEMQLDPRYFLLNRVKVR